MTVRRFLGFAIIALVAFASDRAVAQSSQDRTQRIRQRTFDVVWKTINDKYFDLQFGGVGWADVRRQYEPRVATIGSDAAFVDLLSRMLAEIKISHLRIPDLSTLEQQLGRAEVTRGLALRNIDGRVVMTRIIDRSPAAMAGLQTGFALTAIDGMRVENARSAEGDLADDTMVHRLTVLDERDHTRDVSLGYALPAADRLVTESTIGAMRRVLFETRRLDGLIGYIHFTNFIESLKKRLPATFESMRDALGLIIDLRGNSGGATEAGLLLASLLVERGTQLAIERFRKGDDDYYKAKPRKDCAAVPGCAPAHHEGPRSRGPWTDTGHRSRPDPSATTGEPRRATRGGDCPPAEVDSFAMSVCRCRS